MATHLLFFISDSTLLLLTSLRTTGRRKSINDEEKSATKECAKGTYLHIIAETLSRLLDTLSFSVGSFTKVETIRLWDY